MPLQHIVLHMALCQALARLPSQTVVPVRVVMQDRTGRAPIDQRLNFVRAFGNDGTVDFDSAWGIYRLSVEAGAKNARCSDATFLQILDGHNREVRLTLRPGVARPITPALVSGTLPTEFAYADPTLEMFGSDTACGKPVGTPLDTEIALQPEFDAYYAAVFPRSGTVPAGVVTAIRLTDSSGGHHYIRMPLDLAPGVLPWPEATTFNVTDGVIDYVADKPEDTLLCPRLYKTTVS